MPDDENPKKGHLLLPPFEADDVNDERIASVARALVGLVPMGSALVELAESLRNEPNKQKKEAWLRALGERVNQHQTKLVEVEGDYLSFRVDENGVPDPESVDSDRLVSSVTDHGENDFTITFADAAESDKVIVNPVAGSPSIRVISMGAGALRFAFEDEAPTGRTFELHFRRLPPRGR